MKKISIATFLMTIGTFVVDAQSITEMRIVNEDQHSIVLEFLPKMQSEQVVGSKGAVFTRFRFFGSQVVYDSNGRADYFRSVLLLLPSPKYSLRVLANEFQIMDTVQLLPRPTIKSLKDFGIVEIYDDAASMQKAVPSVQSPLAELMRVGKTGMGYIGTLLLHPIQMIDMKTVRVYSRIVVRLDFEDSMPAGLLSSCLLRGDLPQKQQLAKAAKVSYQKTTSGDSPLAYGDWYRIEVQQAGMYKLDHNYLHGLNINISDINSIRLFGNGGLVVASDMSRPPDSLVEISRLVMRKNSNGAPDQDDFIVFYGRGTRGWKYKGGNNFEHFINPYTEKNYYFFTFGQGTGKSMDTISSTGLSPVFTPASFQEKVFVEQERYNLLNSGSRWVGKLFTGSDNTDVYYNSLPGLVPSSQITYRFNLLHRSASADVLNVYENNQLLSGPLTLGAYLFDGEEIAYAKEVQLSAVRNNSLPGEASVLRISVESSNQDSKTWLDWLEIFYQRKYEVINDLLLFTSPDTAATVQYVVGKLSSQDVFAFDITDHGNVKQITQAVVEPDNIFFKCSFQVSQTAGIAREIAVVGKNKLLVPPSAAKIGNTINLHAAQSYDFIIITPTEFLSEANRLKIHRDSDTSQQSRLNTLVVDINHIYYEFSGGLPDPLAIREFLRYTKDNWLPPMPRYVLLFGYGHYDYKNISTTQQNYIPPYETQESLLPIASYATDDIIAFLNPPNSYDIAIGRLPARSLQEATVMINKIISYETNAPVDPWRNRVTFVADDGKTSEGDEGSLYTGNTDNLAENKSYFPRGFEKKKIYIVEYPTVIGASGRKKPGANRAIVDAINQGTLITNFIGHGNNRLWAHEAIFTKEDDLPQLVNRDRLTFVVAATCNYGRYDNPAELSAAEQLLTMEQGGAIANVSAARSVYNSENVSLISSLYECLLKRNSNGYFPRLGDAWLYAKSNHLNDYRGNSLKYHLFGDPTLRLLIPQNTASIDSINSSSPDSSTVVLKALDCVEVNGSVKRSDGSTMDSFDGKGTIRLFDSQRRVIIYEGKGLFDFKVDGSTLYQGEVSVANGKYKATMPIPKDVTFGKSARVMIYTYNNQTDGVGYTENIMIDGMDTTAVLETTGPRISIYLNDTTTFHSGDVVKNNPRLIVRLWDESGINTSTVGVGHQLSATISNPERSFDLSNYYHTDLDTYQSGEVRYPLGDLSDGEYTLYVKAWDIQNNSSDAEIFFRVHSAEDFALFNVVNYPNPFSNHTYFTLQRNTIDPINVEVKIYSIAGRFLHSIKAENYTDPSVRIFWDGRDSEGSEIANGVYFYKLVIKSQDGRQSNETIGKCAILR